MILAIEDATVGRSDATSRHTSGTRRVTSTHVAPHAHAHAAGRARVGKERLGTVGDRGTKQVKGRQLTRPFLVRDAPYPHRVVSAPSTPPPRASSPAHAATCDAHTAGQRAHLPKPQVGEKKKQVGGSRPGVPCRISGLFEPSGKSGVLPSPPHLLRPRRL